VDAVKEAAKDLEFQAPGGLVKVDGENQHVYKTVRIGEVQGDGQIKELWNSGEPVKPDPFLNGFDWASGLAKSLGQ
jgi:urea transport system substrate-binding protein